MTIAQIKKLAVKARVTDARAEQAWEKAKEIAMNKLQVSKQQLDNRFNIPPKFWGYVMGIAKRELGIHENLQFSEMLEEEEKSELDDWIVHKVKRAQNRSPGDVEHRGFQTKDVKDSLRGCPVIIKGNLFLSNNGLKTLTNAKGIKVAKGVYAASNDITTLQGIHEVFHEINGVLTLQRNPIKSHILGLFKIKGLKRVEWDGPLHEHQWFEIFTEHFPPNKPRKPSAMFDCQSVLIEANLDDYAKL